MVSSGFRVSIDVGGTFTDAVVVSGDGRRVIGKSLTTPERAFRGIAGAVSSAASLLDADLQEVLAATETFIYGTTRATNAIVTRNVAKTAFLTTLGFPDVLVMKEGGKIHAHDFSGDFPQPYIPRRHTFEIPGRIDVAGEVETAFNEAAARGVARQLRAEGFQAVAVCFLWSIMNPSHELEMARILGEELPGVPYTLSHALNPVLREYRRASAAAIDASLKPMMQAHLRELETDMVEAGLACELMVSTSVGGCMRLAEVVEAPINMAKSGPSMAPVAARSFSQLEYGNGSALVCDTGGTTFDVGLVRDGELSYSQESWVGGKWVGDILGISSVDIRSLGAGGGSIIWIDEGGMARVGPQSAGSVPGPACYGLGGKEPTVSDAACVLGYFNPDNFLGGRMTLNKEAARVALAPVAERIGKTVEQTAYDVLQLASDLMIEAIHDVTVSEGYDPNEGVLVAGGGAAGINIMLIAKELGTRELVLPKEASALSAMGMQFSDIMREEAASHFTTSLDFDAEGTRRTFDRLRESLETFAATLPANVPTQIQFYALARYASQVWEIEVTLPEPAEGAPLDVAAFVEAFHLAHERVFGLRDPGSAVEFITWKARLGARIGIAAQRNDRADPSSFGPVIPAERSCFFGGDSPVPTAVYDGRTLPPGYKVHGPCIVEEPTTTLVVFPDMAARVSADGNYLLETADQEQAQ